MLAAGKRRAVATASASCPVHGAVSASMRGIEASSSDTSRLSRSTAAGQPSASIEIRSSRPNDAVLQAAAVPTTARRDARTQGSSDTLLSWDVDAPGAERAAAGAVPFPYTHGMVQTSDAHPLLRAASDDEDMPDVAFGAEEAGRRGVEDIAAQEHLLPRLQQLRVTNSDTCTCAGADTRYERAVHDSIDERGSSKHVRVAVCSGELRFHRDLAELAAASVRVMNDAAQAATAVHTACLCGAVHLREPGGGCVGACVCPGMCGCGRACAASRAAPPGPWVHILHTAGRRAHVRVFGSVPGRAMDLDIAVARFYPHSAPDITILAVHSPEESACRDAFRRNHTHMPPHSAAPHSHALLPGVDTGSMVLPGHASFMHAPVQWPSTLYASSPWASAAHPAPVMQGVAVSADASDSALTQVQHTTAYTATVGGGTRSNSANVATAPRVSRSGMPRRLRTASVSSCTSTQTHASSGTSTSTLEPDDTVCGNNAPEAQSRALSSRMELQEGMESTWLRPGHAVELPAHLRWTPVCTLLDVVLWLRTAL